jgi:hypothetical protein
VNAAHVHLLINHIPVLGALFALLLFLAGLVMRSRDVTKVALLAMVLVALSAIPTYLTGPPAERIVEDLPGVTEAAIAQHEESAGVSLAAVEVLGLLALVGLAVSRGGRAVPTWIVVVVLILAVATSGLMARTANLGAKIRHTEIRTSLPEALPLRAQPVDPMATRASMT